MSMNIIIDVKDFRDALKHSISIKSPMPLMEHVLLEAKDNSLVVNSRDEEHQISSTIRCEVIEEGGVTLNSKLCISTLVGLKDLVTLKELGSHCALTQKGRSFRYPSLKANAWPKFKVDELTPLNIDTAVLADAIDRCSVAMSSTDHRIMFNALCIKPTLIAATQGHFGAVYECTTTLPDGLEVLIPNKVVGAIRKLLINDDAALFLNINDSKTKQIIVNSGNKQLIASLVQQKFPNIERVIPPIKGFELKFNLPVHDTLQILARMSNIGQEIQNKSTSSPILFCEDNGHLTLSNKNSDESLNISVVENPNVHINAPYLRDILNASGDEHVSWLSHESSNMVMFTPEDGSPVRYGIMPIAR